MGVDRPTVADRPADDRAAAYHSLDAHRQLHAPQCSPAERRIDDVTDLGNLGFTQPRRAPDQRVQHELQVGWGAANDPKHLASGSLLLQRLREIPVTVMQLPEQPGVLDRDDRLVGEGLEYL